MRKGNPEGGKFSFDAENRCVWNEMSTKPYVSGAAYINKMSDYCGDYRFWPVSNCPIRSLYWAFLERHQNVLKGSVRLAMPYRNLAKQSAEQRAGHAKMFRQAGAALKRGDRGGHVQVRARSKAKLHRDGEARRRDWEALSLRSRRSYLVTAPPGTEAREATSGLPQHLEATEPTAEQAQAGSDYFLLVETKVQELDWLWLRPNGHCRAQFTATANGWRSSWRIPRPPRGWPLSQVSHRRRLR